MDRFQEAGCESRGREFVADLIVKGGGDRIGFRLEAVLKGVLAVFVNPQGFIEQPFPGIEEHQVPIGFLQEGIGLDSLLVGGHGFLDRSPTFVVSCDLDHDLDVLPPQLLTFRINPGGVKLFG